MLSRKNKFQFSIVILLFLSSKLLAQSDVKMWEESMIIPTYVTGDPDPNPIFYNGRAYQGAKGPVYPYPMLDKLTDERIDKSYNAVFLENRYLKVCILPEIGGRIFYAIDKTNGYNLFYHQHVIKPALIGMLGAWISGGIEWCIPHHHRATTFMPVDYTLQENPDGSKTVWIGELELRHRMKWLLGLTLYPNKSIIEVTGKFFNRTPIVHSFLYWANVAVHANENYQVIFPPSTEFATYHGKNQFTHWPISFEFYHNVDYTKGVNVSRWKNLPVPTSMFAWNCQENFLAGYDHGKEAGVVHVADHHVVPGKKLWTWGTGSPGKIWEKILTEKDGPYLEIMVGAYSDNQPDYSWIQPYEVKTWRQVWYPLQKIGEIQNANEQAAVSLQFPDDNKMQIGFNTTSSYSKSMVLLRNKNQIIFEKEIDISPEKPFLETIDLPVKIQNNDLKVFLVSKDNQELISYKSQMRIDSPLPEVVKSPPKPENIKTNEELYLTGLRLEQFYNPTLEPYPYYEEALRRDPKDIRVNTALGILYYKRGMFEEAEQELRIAVEQVTKNYTRPKDAEANYYLGLVLRNQRKLDEAYDAFSKATWDLAFFSSAYYQLAELACLKNEFHLALQNINHSLTSNSINTKALNLKSAILRRLNRIEEAEKIAAKVVSLDPLDFWGGNERFLIKSENGTKEEANEILTSLIKKMRNYEQSYFELAVDYGKNGFWNEAIDVITRFIVIKQNENIYPLIYYYLGYYFEKKEDNQKAHFYYKKGAESSPAYCFPFRLETEEVLEQAIKTNPNDSKAYYYLGNLFYDLQPEKAIEAWEKSKKLDDSFAIVYRNLGLAYARIQNDVTKAILNMEKAVSLNNRDPRHFYELDVLYEMGNVSAEKRFAVMEENHNTVIQRDDAFSREIILLVQSGKYNKAIEYLTNHHFHTWEGGGQIHQVYVDAYLLSGIQRLKNNQLQVAKSDFESALEYPENLEVGRPMNDYKAFKTYYYLGKTCIALGQKKEADEFYKKLSGIGESLSENLFYKGMALKGLGFGNKAKDIFKKLIVDAQSRLESIPVQDFFTKFGEKQSLEKQRANYFYLTGLGYLGNGEKQKAEEMFAEVKKLNPNHLWADIALYDF